MSMAKSVNITELMTSYSFEIEELPDNLKCAKCKLLLKDACQVPCGCRFCRVCIDDMMASGGEFCSGLSRQCGESLLSLFSLDYRANTNVSRLTVKCTQNGCMHECQLANMEVHFRECRRRIVECPFRELGCKLDKLCADEIDGHLQNDNRRHSNILTGVIVNIRREVETMKQRDKDCRTEIEKIKRDLVRKDEQINVMIDRINHVENENKSIKREKTDLADQVRCLKEKLEREIDERRENDDLDIVRVMGHIDREIAAVTAVIQSNNDDMVKQIKSVENDYQSINHNAKSIKDKNCSIKSKLQSKQVISKLPDAKYDWLISNYIGYQYSQYDIEDNYSGLNSDYFTGAVHPYKYRLKALNFTEVQTLHRWNPMMSLPIFSDSFRIRLLIYRDDTESRQVSWPFEGRVVITVADRDNPEACWSISQQCRIERPSAHNKCGQSDEFAFLHSELGKAGLNLDLGFRVSCEIFPGPG